jgi:hypothetical protein
MKVKNKIKINNRAENSSNSEPKANSSNDGTSGVRTRGWRMWWLGVLAGMVLVILLDQAVASWAAGSGGIEDVKSFASKLTNYVTALAASIAVLFMAISGIRWTMSGGSPMRQTEARNGLVSAAAGLAIALSANVIVSLVIAALQ